MNWTHCHFHLNPFAFDSTENSSFCCFVFDLWLLFPTAIKGLSYFWIYLHNGEQIQIIRFLIKHWTTKLQTHKMKTLEMKNKKVIYNWILSFLCSLSLIFIRILYFVFLIVLYCVFCISDRDIRHGLFLSPVLRAARFHKMGWHSLWGDPNDPQFIFCTDFFLKPTREKTSQGLTLASL